MAESMMEGWIGYACLVVGVSSILVAGVFQSFSDFVMKSLAAAQPVCGAQAMQIINRKVFRSAFLPMLLLLAPASVVLTAFLGLRLPGVDLMLPVAGALLNTVFVFAVTMFSNVPMNNRLAGMDLAAPATLEHWRVYSVRWTRWNHLRTVGALAAGVCYLIMGGGLA